MSTVVAKNERGAILRYPSSFLASLVNSPYSHSSKSSRKQKKARSHKPNKGEVQQQLHHAKIEEQLMSSYQSLLSLGQEVGYYQACQQAHRHEHVSVDLVSLCALDALVPVQEPTSPYILKSDDETVDLFGHVITNSESRDVIITALGVRFCVPAKSSFLLSDLSKIDLLTTSAEASKFSLLVMDPPWENRSAIRGKKYCWLSNEQLLGMPVPRLLAPEAVVAVWVTNKRSIAEFVRTELFPEWNMEFIGEWYWIKVGMSPFHLTYNYRLGTLPLYQVTTAGELVWPMESTHKKPYETVVIGRMRPSGNSPDPLVPSTDLLPDYPEAETSSSTKIEDLSEPPAKKIRAERCSTVKETLGNQFVFLATPTSVHSQKPHLGDLLWRHAPDGERLELFARNLLPGWTSWGDEVLKFQTLRTDDKH